MPPIIAQPTAPPHPDEAARHRHDRLAQATPDQAAAALAYLSMIDPLMFEIAMDAADQVTGAAPRDEPVGDDEAVPVCRRCGGQAGIFPDHGPDWRHFRGDWSTSGAQQIYDPGHLPEVTWRLLGEAPEQR
jgi:hypothetical protein